MRVGQRGVAKNRRNIPCMIHTLRLMTTMQHLNRMKITCSKGEYVLAAYDRICYIGNVLKHPSFANKLNNIEITKRNTAK
jgi:hypothetical protein